jgi:hypothetical protein
MDRTDAPIIATHATWPEGVIARHLAIGGAIVDLKQHAAAR